MEIVADIGEPYLTFITANYCMENFMKPLLVCGLAIGLGFSAIANAGGLLGDALSTLGNAVAPGSNIGQPLDDLNRRLKEQAPVYGTIEEGASAAVRNTSREFLVETGGPTLAAMIEASR